jgi:chaperonin cofactor prefoldin
LAFLFGAKGSVMMNERLEQEVSDLKIRLAVVEKRVDVLEKSIEKIDGNTSWAVKLIIGQMIIGVIGFLFMKGGL